VLISRFRTSSLGDSYDNDKIRDRVDVDNIKEDTDKYIILKRQIQDNVGKKRRLKTRKATVGLAGTLRTFTLH
jgi:hypothetical protein